MRSCDLETTSRLARPQALLPATPRLQKKAESHCKIFKVNRDGARVEVRVQCVLTSQTQRLLTFHSWEHTLCSIGGGNCRHIVTGWHSHEISPYGR